MPKHTLLLALSITFASAWAAQAQPVAMQRVYVVSTAVDPELEAIAGRVGAAARAALRRVDGADWQRADQRFLGYDDNTLEKLRIARVKLEEGRTAYLDLRLDEATTLLVEAVENFDQAMSALEDPADLGTALLFLGAAQTYNNDRRGAARTFTRLHVQMPHLVPDPNLFPPDVIDRYNQAAVRARDGQVTVESDPPGSMAYVDFIPRGLTPVTIGDLPRGEHTIRVVSPGSTPYIENAETGGRRGAASVNAFLLPVDGNEGLDEAVNGIAGHEMRTADGPIGEVGRILDLDKIGVIRVSYGDSQETVKLELVVFDVHNRRRVLRGEVQAPRALGELEEVVARAVQQSIENVLSPQAVDEQHPTFVDLTPTVPETPVERDPLYKKWWLWAAIGAVVVVGAVVTIAVVAGRSDPIGQDSNGQVVFRF
ncbi:MAG: PEGA domain-containing protein [Myxococcales bacterium]|nr:PEGA domain-containing protein [Myxococcales bacterium]